MRNRKTIEYTFRFCHNGKEHWFTARVKDLEEFAKILAKVQERYTNVRTELHSIS